MGALVAFAQGLVRQSVVTRPASASPIPTPELVRNADSQAPPLTYWVLYRSVVF